MNNVRKAVVSTGKFIENHRVAIAVTLTTVICLKLNKLALSDHEDFLREHDLYEKFYTPQD